MATIKLRGDTYLIRCFAGTDVNGKQIRKSMTWKIPEGMSPKKAEKEAQHQAALFEEAVRQGSVLDGNTLKFADFAERWFKDYAQLQLRPRTVLRYKEHMPRINLALGHIAIGKIRPNHIMDFCTALRTPEKLQRYIPIADFKQLLSDQNMTKAQFAAKCGITEYVIRQLYSKGEISIENGKKVAHGLNLPATELFGIKETEHILSPKTQLNYFRLVSTILSWAVKWQVIASNPAERVQAPKQQRKEAAYLDDEQAAELLDKLQAEPIVFRTAVEVLLYTGARRGELLGLKWENIDFDNFTISIQGSILYHPEYGIFEDDTKTESSNRVIKTSENVIALLRKLKVWQSQERLKLGSAWHDEGWVFTSWDGKVFRPDTLSAMFKRFIEKNNLPPVHLHSLRHTNATLLIASGTNLQTVASRLGHASTTTTSRIYSHAIKSADAAAAETLNDILSHKSKIAR